MPTVNGPDEITTLDAGDDKVFFSDSNGDVKEVALGASGEVLTSAGPTADPTFSAIPADPTVGANKTIYSNSSDVVSGVAFGASGTVLTSGGATSAPSWVATAGGAEGSFTAYGSIAAGRAVVLDAAGTVSQLANTLVSNAAGDGTTNNSGYGWSSPMWGMAPSSGRGYYDKSVNHHVRVNQNYQHPTVPWYGGIQLSGFTTASGALTTTNNIGLTLTGYDAGSTGSSAPSSWYDDTGEVGYCAISKGSTALYGYLFAINSSGTAFTTSALTQFSQNSATYAKTGIYIPDLGYSLIFWQNGTGTHYTDIENASAGSTTITVGGNIATTLLDSDAYTSNIGCIKASYDPDNKIIVLAFQAYNAAYATPWLIHYMIGTVSGGSISWGSKQTLTTGAFVNNNMQLCYRSADSKWFMIWNDSPDINYTCAGTWTSGTTMTWSLKAFTSADTYFWKGYNPEAQQLDDELPYVTVMSKDYSEYQRARIFTFKYDASSGHYIAASAPTIPFLPSGSTGLVNFTLSSSGQFGLSYSPDDGKYLWSGMTWAAPYYLQAGSYQPASGSDNSVTFIGIAQSTVTNGQSVDVKWLSSQDTQQSGLTIAAKAYADGTGAITSTVGTNTHIGFAATATDVIITETGSAFV